MQFWAVRKRIFGFGHRDGQNSSSCPFLVVLKVCSYLQIIRVKLQNVVIKLAFHCLFHFQLMCETADQSIAPRRLSFLKKHRQASKFEKWHINRISIYTNTNYGRHFVPPRCSPIYNQPSPYNLYNPSGRQTRRYGRACHLIRIKSYIKDFMTLSLLALLFPWATNWHR